MANCALITITRGSVTGKQLENEFRAQAGPNSTWRWFAKKVADNKFQLRFPTAKKVEDLSFFPGMEMRTVPDVSFRVDIWNPNVGAKKGLEIAWFRIFGLPLEKRTDKKASLVGSLVGIPMEVDKANLKRWYVRVKIGCRDMTKVPAVVEGLLDFHFYDFTFQREVPVEGVTDPTGTKWTRTTDRSNEDFPSPKKHKWSGGTGNKDNQSGSSQTGSKSQKQQGGAEDQVKEDEQLHSEKSNGVDLETQIPTNRATDGQRKGKEKKVDVPEPNLVEDATGGGASSDEDSADQGLTFDDIISPGGEHLNFGSFQNMDIRNIWNFRTNEEVSVPINICGTNLSKSKYDPLTVIEAKNAMTLGKEGLRDYLLNLKPVEKCLQSEKTLDFQVENVTEKDTCTSPFNGTQEAPTCDLSSQEDGFKSSQPIQEHEEKQSVNKGYEQEASLEWSKLMGETEKEIPKDKSVVRAEGLQAEKEVELARGEDTFPQPGEEPLLDQHVMRVNVQKEKKGEPIRQSERLKNQEDANLKIAEKAERATMKKNLGGLQKTEDRVQLEAGAEVLKKAALHFHNEGASPGDAGVVLLQ
ncbi:hypothetical protein C2845_PM15G05560 [Panicum miliaceum]|uniref:Uncharacterized protein n=1 Tax=Panicum miliaceum TaxID=4540 RepID=A0A3L6Q776_PANMI|nr:hypothetical protein C2845_PM15G05560 [Panicum miliaceum]